MSQNEIQAFVSRYILDASRSPTKRKEVIETLDSGKPHCKIVNAAVALIDISGFTALTAELAKRGKISSELITQTVCEYLSDIITVVWTYQGDIVKFLGDALLICFDESKNEDVTNESFRVSAYKAVACAADVMIKCGTKPIELPNYDSSPTSATTTIQLKLHIAVGAGSVTHVIIGSPLKTGRCDYCISGECLQDIGDILGETLPGEMSITASIRNITTFSSPPTWLFNETQARLVPETNGLIFTQTATETVRSISSKNIQNLHLKLDKVKGSKESSLASADFMDDTLNVLTFCKMFVNQSLVWKLEQEQLMTEGAGQKPGMIHRTSVFRKSIFLPSGDVLQYDRSGDAIAVTPKFQMKTRISEFRCLSIMFIKLNFPYDPQKAQTIFVKVDEILAECAGYIQQFSVDDKGQTLLSIFGLPPRTHENNATFALKAATLVSAFLQKAGITPATLAVTTNEILYSTLGNSLRSEASILGDVVNLAARIMCLSADQISDDEAVVVLCDDTTREATSDVFPAKMMGTFKFKGMKEEVKVWKVDAGQHERKKKESEYISQSQSFLVGYTEEREQLRVCIDDWHFFGKRATAIIEASSGMGKSSLLNFGLQVARNYEDIWLCQSEGSEIDQSTPYFAFQTIIPRLLDLSEQLFFDTSIQRSRSFSQPEDVENTSFFSLTKMTQTRNDKRRGSVVSGASRDFGITSQHQDSIRRDNASILSGAPPMIRIEGDEEGVIQEESRRRSIGEAVTSMLSDEDGSDSQPTTGRRNLTLRSRITSRRRFGSVNSASNTHEISRGSIAISSHIKRILNIINAMNEPSDTAPLLNLILPWLNMPETPRTMHMNPQAKKELLKSLIVKILLKASERAKLAFTFDDLQWFDSASLEIVQMIVRSCPKVLCILVTRPIEEYNLVGIGRICKLPYVIHLPLRGFSIEETQEYLVWRFRDKGVQSIDQSLLSEFYKRSGGCPLFADQAAETLIAAFNERLQVSPVGALETNYDLVDYEALLIKSVDAAIASTFDQLNPTFQSLLRVAAVFGQYFELDAVAEVMEADVEVEDLRNWIEEHDKFSYLKPHGNADELGNENEYMFRHVMIQSAIYNALPFLNREECHFRIVELYESILGYDNQPKILPMLTYHALRTSDKLRKIKYLDEVSSFYIGQYLLQEAALSLKTVLSIADTDVEIKANTLRMSKWWSLLAFAQVYLRQYKAGREAGLTALKLIGVDWPKTPAEYIKQTKEEATRLVRLWLATVGGRLPTYHRLPEVFRDKTDIVLRVLPVFREIVAYDPTLPQSEQPLIANMYINASITIAAKGGVDEFIKALVRKAQVHLCGGETAKFWFFLNKAIPMLPKVKLESHVTFFVMGCISYYRGDYEETIMYWERAISNADNVGDHGSFRLYTSYIMAAYTSAGKGDQAIKIYDDQMEAAIGAEDLVTQVIILSNHLHMCSYYLRDTGEVAGHLKKYEHILGILAPYRRLAMLSATLFHIRCGDFENAYAVIEGFAVASEKMLANQIVPLMIFAHSSIGAILLITEWKDADKIKLEATFKNLFTRTKAIWSRVTLPGKFACQLIEAAMLLVVGKKKEAVKVLRNGLSHNTSPKNAGIFAAFHSVVIARFSTNPAERDKYSQAALGLLDKYKLAGFAEWMEGKPYVKMR